MLENLLRDRYHIQSLLGRKTGRRTFLATDLETRSPVVIKLLLFGSDFTWDDLKLFEREAETLKSLDHPAIPKYLDFFEVNMKSGKGFALVQSYIEARSLQDWVQSGRTFSEAEIKAIATELLTILDYLHTRQPPVIHRDIKPSNVLLGVGEACANRIRSGNSPGQVYLVDFGSVQTAQQGGTITVVGTYGYMPPEQFGGKTSHASDLYSTGATLIYLATGQHPADLPQNDLHIEFEPVATLSQPFIHWLRWLTNPGLFKRPASANKAIKTLQQGFQANSMQLSTKYSSVGVSRPSSTIQLQKTPASLEITVPPNKFGSEKIDLQKNSLQTLGCLVFLSSFVVCYMLEVIGLGVIGAFWVPCSLILAILTFLFSKKDGRASPPYKITLQSKGNSVFVDFISPSLKNSDKIFPIMKRVIPLSLKNSDKIFPMKLKALRAGHNDVPQYRLSLSCSSDLLYITGSRTEIQWLCDELNEWTGLEISYTDYRSSGC